MRSSSPMVIVPHGATPPTSSLAFRQCIGDGRVLVPERTHFLEPPIQFMVLVALVLWLLGANFEGLTYMAVVGPGLLYVSHLDVRLPFGPLMGIVVGPQYHRIHRERVERNEHASFAGTLGVGIFGPNPE